MIDFSEVKKRYREDPIAILKRIIGAGRVEGGDYVALNPRRCDKKAGSFRIDIASGKFHDFATGDRGGSVIDLAAFVFNCDIATAAQKLRQLSKTAYLSESCFLMCSRISYIFQILVIFSIALCIVSVI